MSENEETVGERGAYLVHVASSLVDEILNESVLSLDPLLTVESFLERAQPALPQAHLEEPVRDLLMSDWFLETLRARARPAIGMFLDQELEPNGRDPAWIMDPDNWPPSLAEMYPSAPPDALLRAAMRSAALMEAAFLAQVALSEISHGEDRGPTHWESFDVFVGVWAALIGRQQDPRELPIFSGFYVTTCGTLFGAAIAQIEEDGLVGGFRRKKQRVVADALAGFYLCCGADLGDVIRPPIPSG